MNYNNLPLNIVATRIAAAVEKIGLDLSGQRVLTEAASGAYIATPVIAALAGADRVTACTRDSQWGKSANIVDLTIELANYFGVTNRIHITTDSPVNKAHDADVVTNLGFVRPISRELIRRLPNNAAVALMWEPWEFRSEDIDLSACRDFEIPIIATNERHPNLNTFQAVGMLAVKLLLESQCEISGLNILVIGSDPFGEACSNILTKLGAHVRQFIPFDDWVNDDIKSEFFDADAVVVVEHKYKGEILGSANPELVRILSRRMAPIVHICGRIDKVFIDSFGVSKYPPQVVKDGFMTLTTAYVGIKPVVDLHAAGLHVGSIVARGRTDGKSIDESIEQAVSSGYGLKL